MQALFESGRIIDLVLLIFVIEAAVAIVWLRRRQRGIAGLAANLAAGACLLLALRAALVGSGWQAVAFWIGLSLPFHLLDLVSRWHAPAPRPHQPASVCHDVVPPDERPIARIEGERRLGPASPPGQARTVAEAGKPG